MFLIITACHSGLTTSTGRSYNDDELKYNEKICKSMKTYMKIAFALLFTSGILECIIPTRQTVLLIAASEISEKIINKPEVQGIIDPSIDLLKTWIKAQTETLQKTMTNGVAK